MSTAAEARLLWCPMSRVAALDDDGKGVSRGQSVFNRLQNGTEVAMPNAGRCISSECAMWRWSMTAPALRDAEIWYPEDERDSAVERMRKVEPPRPEKVAADAIWVPVFGQLDDDTLDGGYWIESAATVSVDNERTAGMRRGYCGLAGAVSL